MPNNIIMADPKDGDPYEVARKLVDKSITEYIDPDVDFIGASVFSKCPNLKKIVCHGVKTLSDSSGSIFNVNTTLTTGLAFPNAVSFGNNGALRYCQTPAIDLGEAFHAEIKSYFMADSTATVLVLRSQTVMALGHIGSLPTAYQNGKTGGTIYIPKVLYDHLGDGSANDYKARSNWSTVDGYGTITWAQIEGSIYETQYADGTPIPTGG